MEDTQLMLQTGFIDRLVEDDIIPQRITDGYVHATAMCKACGKQISDYLRLGVTKSFIDELSSVRGIPRTELVQTIKGGTPEFQGTWVHPLLAINLGQWLSPKFAVLVSTWVFEWQSGNILTPSLPYHLRRYMANMNKVPYGYFSMLNEITLSLIGPLEQMGYTLPASMIPDGSLGKVFSNHLRRLGCPVNSYPTYVHGFEDGREIQGVRCYPNELLPELRKYFIETWMKEKSLTYFRARSPEALPYLQKFLTLPNYREAMGYIEQDTVYIE
jgi:hypothetical protein